MGFPALFHESKKRHRPHRIRQAHCAIAKGGRTSTFAYGPVQVRRRIGGVAIETANSNGGCAAGGGALHYVLRDHLGSVDALLDGAGGAVQGMAFGPWGARRQPGTGNELTEAQRTGFDACRTTRGFTGHETVDALGVVHMNGRIYDPALARFLQADPFVQFPADVQSWNRYSYVLNNPLAYTDPSGHFVFSLAALVAVSAQQGITWYAAAAIVGAAGFGDALAQGASFGQALRSGLFSGLSAAAFTGIGAGLGTEFSGTFAAGLNAPGFGLKVALHGTVGGITSVLQGGRFGHGFAASGFTALASGLNNSRHVGRPGFSPLRVAIGAAVGGTASRVTGGKFANGAVTGAFSQALNNEQAEVQAQEEAERQAIVQQRRAAIIAKAEEALAKGEPYAVEDVNGLFRRGDYKCNKFVCDVANAAKARIEMKTDDHGLQWPPLAGDFGDPSYPIPGWKIVATPQPGDIVAQLRGYEDASGHVGIIVDDSLNVISARSVGLTKEPLEVVFPENFRGNSFVKGKIVYRRYVGE